MSSNLSKHILTTLVYYDVMDYPMTSFEVWKYLTRTSNLNQPTDRQAPGGDSDNQNERYSLAEVIKELDGDGLKKNIGEYRGYYFLKGRKDLVGQRIGRNKIAESKFKIARRVAWWLRFVPFVRGIAVTGRLAMKNTESKSDLDFLIVLKKGRIFTGRALVTFLVHILGKRRYGAKIANRACLNYFITDKSLEINLKDIFSASEYHFITPVFGRKTFRKFQIKNGWLKKHKVHYQPDEVVNLKLLKDSKPAKIIRKIGEKLFKIDFIERYLRAWQLERIAADPRTHKPGSMIIATDESLVFLPDPQSPKVFEKFQERLANLE
ncbi:MAG: hypothetical protein Q8L10_05330 [Candidatus Moranbacteria bacterium]|nr:hypothetical protein [Candidatus Moranbacteria bacterium]